MQVIPGYENYLISSKGYVFSIEKNKYLKPWKLKTGYYQVHIRKDGIRKAFTIHRLVMLTFEGYSELQVNHKDGDKTNNDISNLEYVTCSENAIHAYKNRLRVGPKFWLNCEPGKHPQARKVVVTYKDGSEIIYPSIKDAAFAIDRTTASIIQALNRGVKNRYGLKFRYYAEV